MALTYSGHKLKSKNLLAMLTNGSRFTRDAHFKQLQPTYTVTTQEIEDFKNPAYRSINNSESPLNTIYLPVGMEYKVRLLLQKLLNPALIPLMCAIVR